MKRGKHNLIALIMHDADYVLKYSESFPWLSRPTIYGKLKDILVGVPCVRAEATHNDLLDDWGM